MSEETALLVELSKESLMSRTKSEAYGQLNFASLDGLDAYRRVFERILDYALVPFSELDRLLVGLRVSPEFLEATIRGGPARDHDVRRYAEYFLKKWYPTSR